MAAAIETFRIDHTVVGRVDYSFRAHVRRAFRPGPDVVPSRCPSNVRRPLRAANDTRGGERSGKLRAVRASHSVRCVRNRCLIGAYLRTIESLSRRFPRGGEARDPLRRRTVRGAIVSRAPIACPRPNARAPMPIPWARSGSELPPSNLPSPPLDICLSSA